MRPRFSAVCAGVAAGALALAFNASSAQGAGAHSSPTAKTRARTLGAATEETPPQVQVYYGQKYGMSQNSLVAHTRQYSLGYNLVGGGATQLGVTRSGAAVVNFLDATARSFDPAVEADGDWYRASNASQAAKMGVLKAGPVMWQVEVANMTLADASGRTLPLQVTETFTFWQQKFYLTTQWTPTADITGIQDAEIDTHVNPSEVQGYNTDPVNGSQPPISASLHPLPPSGNVSFPGVPDQVTLSGPAGALTYEVIDKHGTDALAVDRSGSSLVLRQQAYDASLHGGATTTWYYGYGSSTYSEVFLSPQRSPLSGLTDAWTEAHPLTGTQFQIVDSLPWAGSTFGGYDPTTGAYVINKAALSSTYGWYDQGYQNLYPSVEFHIQNNSVPRTIRLETTLPPDGAYVAGVTGGDSFLTNADLDPNGIPVQTNKKWDNTNDDDWSTYSETYTSFPLGDDQQTTMWHRTAFQNWGSKTAVGLPTTNLTNYQFPTNSGTSPLTGQLWIETNEGLSEAATYDLYDSSADCTICDFRAINGNPIGAPWFQSAVSVDFLSLAGDVAKEYGAPIQWLKLGPNLSQFRFTLSTGSTDLPGQATVTASLVPSNNGTRVFYNIDYTFPKTETFPGIQKDLSFLTLGSRAAGNALPLAYGNADGDVTTLDQATTGQWALVGQPLIGTNPWVGFYQEPSNWNDGGAVVDKVSGTLDGHAVNRLALSVQSHSAGDASAYLVPDTTDNTVRAGDHVDLQLELYSWNPSQGYQGLENEAKSWPASVSVTHGTNVTGATTPTIEVAADQTTQFTVKGGTDYVPVSVSGFDSPAQPVIDQWDGSSWQPFSQSVGMNDYWQTDRSASLRGSTRHGPGRRPPSIDPGTGRYTITYDLPASSPGQEYRVSMEKPTAPTLPTPEAAPQSNANLISGFTLPDHELYGPAVINPINHTVNFTVRQGVSLSSITPKITISMGATIAPASGVVTNFSSPVKYTVTAQNGTPQTWTVTATTQ